MHGLYEMVAAPSPIEIDGGTYWLSPLRLVEIGQIEQRILAGRPRAMDLLKDRIRDLPEAVQLDLARTAFEEERRGPRVTDDDLNAFLKTRQGAVLKFWLMLRRKHPALTEEDAEKLIVAAGIEAAIAAMQQASGDQLGNPSRLSRLVARVRKSRGGASFVNWLRRITGRPSKSAS